MNCAWPDMSCRTGRALENARIETWEDLAKKKPEDLLRLNNFGRKALAEVEAKLAVRGLSLAPTERPSCFQASHREIFRRARVIIGNALEPMTPQLEAAAQADEEGARVLVALRELLRGGRA